MTGVQGGPKHTDNCFGQKSGKVRVMATKKVQILNELFVIEPQDQKKKWIPHSIYNQNHCVPMKNKFLLKINV